MKHLYNHLKPFVVIALVIIIQSFCSEATAQGYIYVQKKTLDETSSVDFTFTVSGGTGTTAVPNFILNDQDDQIPVQDLGASQNGRLWAVGTNNILYYRDLGSAAWIATGVNNAYRVDGGPGNTCYFISINSDPFSYIGGVATQLGNWASHGNSPTQDIGCAWNTQPYITTDAGLIWQRNLANTAWVQIGTSTDNTRIDGNPFNGNALVGKTDDNVYSITSAGVATSLGKPPATGFNVQDLAVTSDGTIFATYIIPALAGNGYVFKWLSGTTWSAEETTSRNYTTRTMTAGLGGQVWGTYTLNTTSDENRNIFTRTFDGTNTLWLNDERVRTTIAGNSQMMAVNPGTYTITETVPGGWDLQHLNVYDPTNNSSTSLTGNTATVTVAAGETVTVVFENGLVIPFAMTNSCSSSYLEDFGTGAAGTYGAPLTGQTSYHYQIIDNTFANNYKVIGNASMLFGGAANLADHTSGNGQGRMMAVDANNEKDAFFRRRFTGIIPGATYTFSAWIANINAGALIKPNVLFEVIDPTNYSVQQSLNTGDITSNAVWTKYSLSFTASVNTFDLVISNNGFGGSGNDLVIDDISFTLTPVTTPVTTKINTGCGTLGSITVTSPVGASYEYSKDAFATAPQSSPVFSNLAPGTFTVSARFVGTTNCITSKVDVIGATICGNIWNDANGNATNNSEANITSGVWVNLTDPLTHAVLQSVQADASGNYSFTGLIQNTNYQIILTTSNQTGNTNLTAATLPVDFVVTGTNLSGVANTANTTGVITVNTGTSGLTVQNFGMEKLPDSNPKTQLTGYPTGGTIPAGSATTQVTGTDAEDGPLSGTNHSIAITFLPANATMRYNGAVVSVGQQITNFDPTKLSFTGITNGSVNVVFEYAFIDNAGKQDPTPAKYTLSWAQTAALPVTLESFTGTAKDCNTTLLNWKVSDAVNFSRFEIERSSNGIDFKVKGTVFYNAAIARYNFTETIIEKGAYQYRLKMIDTDGKSKYSPIAFIRLDCNQQRTVQVFPNPAKDNVSVNGLKGDEKVTMYNSQGQLVYNKNVTDYQLNINMRTFTSGLYYIIVTDKSGEKISETKIAKMD